MKKILIAEQGEPGIEQVRGELVKNGFTVFQADTAEKALELHEKEHADLILAGLDIAEMGGDGLASAMRGHDELRKGVYIILLCNGRKADLERCGKSGANAYARRPIDPDELSKRILAIVANNLMRATRVLVKVDVKSMYHNESFFCTSMNLSVSGMLLESDRTLAKGDHINLSFFLPDEDRIIADGHIVRVARGDESKYIYGVEFSIIDEDHQGIIESFVEEQRANGNFY